MAKGIDILLDKELLSRGFEHYHKLDLDTASWLVFGASGSGKSVLVKSIVGRIGLHIPTAKAMVCDGKADDYTFLRGIEGARHYEFLDTATGLSAFYSKFERRLSGEDESRDLRLLVIEEWGSFLRAVEEIDKKAAKTATAQLFWLTSQGRSYNVHVLLSVQRPDATLLSGFRENFTTVIGLGRISTEAAKMVGFSDFDNFEKNGGGQGVGYLLSDTGFFRVQVPRIKDFDKLHKAITAAVTR